MHLDTREVEDREGITQGVAVVGQRAGVDDDGRGAVRPGAVDTVDEVGLGLVLLVIELVAERDRLVAGRGDDSREVIAAVLRRVAGPELREVRAVEQQ